MPLVEPSFCKCCLEPCTGSWCSEACRIAEEHDWWEFEDEEGEEE